MKRLFLSSSFAEVSSLFERCLDEDLKGKKITFIPTASINEEIDFYVKDAKNSFLNMGLEVDELEISTALKNEIKNKIENNDYIYVSGGNTFFLLEQLKISGADEIIKDQISKGKVYICESAGSIVLSPNIEYIELMDERVNLSVKDDDALNQVDFYPVPHFGDFPFEESSKNIVEKYQDKLNLKTFSNDELIIVEDRNVKVLKKDMA